MGRKVAVMQEIPSLLGRDWVQHRDSQEPATGSMYNRQTATAQHKAAGVAQEKYKRSAIGPRILVIENPLCIEMRGKRTNGESRENQSEINMSRAGPCSFRVLDSLSATDYSLHLPGHKLA